MTIKLVTEPPPPPGEGQALVYEVNLPSKLEAGSWITGSIKTQNIGEGDKLRCLITTEWDGEQFAGEGDVPADYILTITISAGLITMPEIDAVITIEGQHLEAGVWVTDDTKTH